MEGALRLRDWEAGQSYKHAGPVRAVGNPGGPATPGQGGAQVGGRQLAPQVCPIMGRGQWSWGSHGPRLHVPRAGAP